MLSYPAEIVSDMSRFHRADDLKAMPSRRFFALAGLLARYDGALLAALKAEAAAAASAPVPATKLMYDSNPELRGLSSFAEVRKPAQLSPEEQAYIDAHPELQSPPPR